MGRKSVSTLYEASWKGKPALICGTSDLAEEWSGLVIILDAERSRNSKKSLELTFRIDLL